MLNRMRSALALGAVVASLLTSMAPGDSLADPGRWATQHGRVVSGRDPVAHARVVVYEAGSSPTSARLLGVGRADDRGEFTVRYERPSPDSVVYVLAAGQGMENRVRFATVLGRGRFPDRVTINERTTVATAFAMSSFIDRRRIGGPYPGMPNAADTVRNVADIETGAIADLLRTAPNGAETSAMPTVNTLANMMTPCVRDRRSCPDLFDHARSAAGLRPHDTFEAMVNVARNPGNDVPELMAVSLEHPVYEPALPPQAVSDENARDFVNSWVIALRYVGDANDPSIDGPGNIALDRHGNAWVNNNYVYDENRARIVCGSTEVIKLTPTGGYAPGSPYGGDDSMGDGANAGGVYGAGFGIAVDENDGAWVTSFAFQGEPANEPPDQPTCPNSPQDIGVNVGQFSRGGTTLSPSGDLTIMPQSAATAGGWLGVPLDPDNDDPALRWSIYLPQGVRSDRKGNVWVTSCGNGYVTKFVGGDPNEVVTSGHVVDQGFDLTIDPRGHVWATGNKSQDVVELDGDGRPVPGGRVTGFVLPMGIASDSEGNLWVADAGVPAPPCPALKERAAGTDDSEGAENRAAAVSVIRRQDGDRVVTKYGRGNDGIPRDGLRWPWGIAIDGGDNVWVANFKGNRLMYLCGVAEHCNGKRVGDPLSPDSGYVLNALERVTAVTIDPSGNVWATNNWINDGFDHPQNPGGRHVVVLLGVAHPVKTPLLGYPEAP